MESELVLIDREVLLAELQRVFDVQTADALVGVLDKVAAQVRAAGVTREDFSEMKQIVAELVEAQRRTEERVTELVEAQRRTEERVTELAEAQRRTEQRIEELTEAVRWLTEAVGDLKGRMQRVEDIVGGLKGRMLEMTYRDKAVAYFGRLLRRTRVITPEALDQLLEAHLSAEEFGEVVLLDLVVSGQPRLHPEIPEVWLAIEVSAVVDAGDVTRARERAALLRQAGYRAIPMAAGERATLGAEDEARLHKVVVLQDGRSFLWEEALAAWAREESTSR